jgi:hypothetical protein
MWTWCSRPLCSCRCRRVLASDELTFRAGSWMGQDDEYRTICVQPYIYSPCAMRTLICVCACVGAKGGNFSSECPYAFVLYAPVCIILTPCQQLRLAPLCTSIYTRTYAACTATQHARVRTPLHATRAHAHVLAPHTQEAYLHHTHNRHT